MSMKSEDNIENVRNWFNNFITSVRENYEKFTSEEKDVIQNHNDYRNPCQIEIFWIKEPDAQLIIKTNFQDLPDKEIVINGPFSRNEFFEKIKPILLKPKWQRSLRDNTNEDSMFFEESRFPDSLALDLHQFVEEIKNRDFIDSASLKEIGHGMMLGDSGWSQSYFGDISKTDYKLAVDKIIKDLQEDFETRKKMLSELLTKPVRILGINHDGYGTHFYPPVYIGKKPKRTVEQLLHGHKIQRSLHDKALDAKFDNEIVIVNRDGFIFVKTSEKKTALQVLNLIMALGYFHGTPFFIVREHELAKVHYDKERKMISGWMMGGPKSLRSPLHNTNFGDDSTLEFETIEINEKTILEIINEANEIWKNKPLVNKLLLFLESFTHHRNNEFSQSFVMSWIIIEQYIHQIWDDSIRKKQLRKYREDKLGRYSIDQILESLDFSGLLKKEEYELLSDLKTKRNNFIHNSATIDKDISAKSLGLANTIVTQALPSGFLTD